MPLPAHPISPPPRAIPVAPSVEEWRAMSPRARERFVVSVNEALSESKAQQAVAHLHELEMRAQEADVRAQQAMAGMREGIVALLRAKEIPLPDDSMLKLNECDDPETLQRWLTRAAVATSAAEVFSDP